MKKLISALVAALTLGAGAFGQALPATPLPTVSMASTSPQFALSILTDYFEKDERDDKAGGVVLASIGGVLFAGGLAGAVYSLTPPPAGGMYSDVNGQMLVRYLGISASATGAILGGIGIGLLAKPDDRYKREYAYLFAEPDPVVQEAIAYGVMKELADDAKRGRIVSGLINIATPVAAAGGFALSAAITDSWDDFGDNVVGRLSWTIPSLVSGIIMLATGKSSEERMLDSYRAMSASYAASSRGED